MAHMKWAASTHTQHLGFAPSSISRRSRRCREAGVVLRICEMMEVDTHFTLCVRLISLRFLRFPEEFLDFDLFFRENDTLCHRHTHCIHFVVTAVIEFVRPQNPRDPALLRFDHQCVHIKHKHQGHHGITPHPMHHPLRPLPAVSTWTRFLSAVSGPDGASRADGGRPGCGAERVRGLE